METHIVKDSEGNFFFIHKNEGKITASHLYQTKSKTVRILESHIFFDSFRQRGDTVLMELGYLTGEEVALLWQKHWKQ